MKRHNEVTHFVPLLQQHMQFLAETVIVAALQESRYKRSQGFPFWIW